VEWTDDRDERGYYRPGSVSQGSGRNGPSGLREETVYPDEDDDEDTVVESKVSTVVSTVSKQLSSGAFELRLISLFSGLGCRN